MNLATPPSRNPQVRLPTGCLTLPVGSTGLVAHLDSILRDVLEPQAPPPPPDALPRPEPESRRRLPRMVSVVANPNHHLWNNHGVWFLHCTIYPTRATKERLRRTLQTSCIVEARQRRDAQMAELVAQGLRPAVE